MTAPLIPLCTACGRRAPAEHDSKCVECRDAYTAACESRYRALEDDPDWNSGCAPEGPHPGVPRTFA